jgi:hypothetical protein
VPVNALKMSINPNAYSSRYKKIAAGCNTTKLRTSDARGLRKLR